MNAVKTRRNCDEIRPRARRRKYHNYGHWTEALEDDERKGTGG